ncbi:transcriptional regulator NanR [uncultured Cohaesibacter sp.]|uniref:transcriptional regulator NanR n=1 Tax=uncultured Cohaesibacter sp. TaxID=1002546 RepID=UPI0029C64780|nr:transcriptional regulator NanR [uncultured Cohaesibacter sp.]
MSEFGDQRGDRKIVRQKLSDQVVDELRSMIRSGELTPDDYLPSERDLMQRFGVGRPAVREALQALHTQGLITIKHGERSRVNKVTATAVLDHVNEIARLLLYSAPKNFEHLKQARRMFERGIVREATRMAKEEDIKALRALIDRQEKELGNPGVFVEVDILFHTRIAEITNNPIIVAASSAMLRWLMEYQYELLHWAGNETITLREHSKIVDNIESGNEDAAVSEMQHHLDRTNRLYNS